MRSRACRSVRFANLAHISNPYLSQIERGLYEPSASVLKAIATALGIPPERLYAAAGWFEPERGNEHDVETAIRSESPPKRQPEGGLDRGLPRLPEPSTEEIAYPLISSLVAAGLRPRSANANRAESPDGASGSVAGLTNTMASRQRGHNRQCHTQGKRSARAADGRVPSDEECLADGAVREPTVPDPPGYGIGRQEQQRSNARA